MSADWVHMGPEARRLGTLAYCQLSYALTIRQQVARGLAYEAAKRAQATVYSVTELGEESIEWHRIAQRCRAEARRAYRAHVKLGPAPSCR